jgi:hypothetical protein
MTQTNMACMAWLGCFLAPEWIVSFENRSQSDLSESCRIVQKDSRSVEACGGRLKPVHQRGLTRHDWHIGIRHSAELQIVNLCDLEFGGEIRARLQIEWTIRRILDRVQAVVTGHLKGR